MITFIQIALSILLLFGCFFIRVGALGLVKLSTFFKRLHAPTTARQSAKAVNDSRNGADSGSSSRLAIKLRVAVSHSSLGSTQLLLTFPSFSAFTINC